MAKAFWKEGSRLMIASLLSNFFLYLTQLLSSRTLSATDFASVSSLMNLLMLLSIPMQTITLIVSKKVATLVARGEEDRLSTILKAIFTFCFYCGLLFFLILGLLNPLFSHFFNIYPPLYFTLLSISMITNLFFASASAILEGFLQLRSLSFLWIVSSFLRLVSVCLLWLWQGSGLCLMALSGSFSVLVAVGSWYKILMICRQKIDKTFLVFPRLVLRRMDWHFLWQFAPTLATQMGLALLLQTDVSYVKKYFTGDIAGGYAACAMVSKLMVYIPTAMVTGMYPMLNQAQAKGEKSTSLLWQVVGLTFTMIALGSFVLLWQSLWCFRLIFGDTLASHALPYVRYTLFGLTPYAIVSIFSYYFLANQRYVYAYALLCLALLFLVALWFLPVSVVYLSYSLMVVWIFALVIAFYLLYCCS